jgi:DNA-binding transcriptional MerR regulator
MRNSDMAKRGLMRISEVAKATCVSLPTIHYYTREGLIFPSLKTAHNMAYYSQDSVKDIQLIKDLQSKRFLPLHVIKLILRAKREGQDEEHVVEMSSVLSDIFQPTANEATFKTLSLSKLVSASELSESEIKALEDKRLILPKNTEHGSSYDDIDVRIAQTFKKLVGFGLKPDDFDIYYQYMELVRTEFRALHNRIHKLPNHEKISLREILKLIKDLKESLEIRIIRQETEHSREQDVQGEKE